MNEIFKKILEDFDPSALHGKGSDFVLKELCHMANKLLGRTCPICGA